MPKSEHEILGGPERRAFGKDNVHPLNFSESDPFWDVGKISKNLDKNCREGKVEDFILICRTGDGVEYRWRGKSPMTTVLGMLDYTKDMILDGTR